MIVALMLGVFVLIASIVIVRKNKNDRKKEIEFFLWFFLIVAILMLIMRLASEERPGAKEKPLNIKTTTKELCFYVDSFDGMEDFVISSVNIDKVSYDGYKNIFKDSEVEKNNKNLLSSIVGIDNCFKYDFIGNIELHNETTLNLDSIYIARIYAKNKNRSSKTFTTRNDVELIAHFYLFKNPTANTVEAIILNDEDVNAWEKKIQDKNK